MMTSTITLILLYFLGIMVIDDNKEIKVDFRYFISLALDKKISWRSMPSILEDFIPTLEKSKEVIGVLLKELQKLQSQLLQKEVVKVEDSDDLEIVEIPQESEQDSNSSHKLCICMSKGDLSMKIDDKSNNEEVIDTVEDFDKFIEAPSENIANEENETDANPSENLENEFNESTAEVEISDEQPNLHDISTQIDDKDKLDDVDYQDENEHQSLELEQDTEKQLSNGQELIEGNRTDLISNEDEQKLSQDNHSIKFKASDKTQCNICEKTVSFANLEQHLRVHSGRKPFQCSICEKSFKHSKNLKIHEKSHSGNNLFYCKVCPKVFDRAINLKVHERIHTGEKPHHCSFCDKRFRHRGSLKNHEKVQHNWEGLNLNNFYTFVGENTINEEQIVNKVSGDFSYENTKNKIDASEKQSDIGHLKSGDKCLLKDSDVSQTNDIKQKNFECNVCGKILANLISLQGHEKVHSGIHSLKRPHHQCKTCKKDFSSVSNLNKHMKIHSEVKPYSCKTCLRTFHKSDYLKGHERVHSNERPYQCSLCDKKFKGSKSLEFHYRTHTEEFPYECKICIEKFRHRKLLLKHNLKYHKGGNENDYACKLCKKEFLDSQGLKTHMIVHSNEKPYNCQFCDKTFKRKWVLTSHHKMHNGEERKKVPEKKQQCPTCGKLVSFSGLKNHEATHTDERPYQCEICFKQFKTLLALKIHKDVHSDEKQFECRTCKKRFNKQPNLIRHQRTHTGELPYDCKTCGVRFSQWTSLHRHKKKGHEDTK